MSESQAERLRALLEEIDGQLLALLTGADHPDEATLGKVALYETARGAVLRLLAVTPDLPST